MTIELELNGKRVEVTKEQIFDAALKGIIKPETKVWVNGVEHAVGRIKGIQFPNTNNRPPEPDPDPARIKAVRFPNTNNAAMPLPPIQGTSTPENTQTLPPPPPPFHKAKKRWVYILLGFFLYGVHSLYAGYILQGIVKLLCFVLLALFCSSVVSADFYLWRLDPLCPLLWLIFLCFSVEKLAIGPVALSTMAFLKDMFYVTEDVNGVPFE